MLGDVVRWLAALVMLLPLPALACSGEGALAVIEEAEHRGWVMFAITVGIVAAGATLAIVRKRIGAAIAMIPVVFLHPAIWFGARHGDCGALLRQASTLYLVIAPLACAMLYLLSARRAQRAADPTQL